MVKLTNISSGPLVDNLKEGTLRLAVGASKELEDNLLTNHIDNLVKKRILKKEVIIKQAPPQQRNQEEVKSGEVKKQQKNATENKSKEE